MPVLNTHKNRCESQAGVEHAQIKCQENAVVEHTTTNVRDMLA